MLVLAGFNNKSGGTVAERRLHVKRFIIPGHGEILLLIALAGVDLRRLRECPGRLPRVAQK